MADNAILFKFVAKSVGMKYGITPTFMAKPYSDVRFPLSLLSPCNVVRDGRRKLIIDARDFWSYSRFYT
jgi:hypothetical protein